MYEINSERLIRIFLDLVKIPSPSWMEKKVIDYITKILDELGVHYTLYPCGTSNNLYAWLDGNTSKKPILFSCHTDTVIPCENVKPVISQNKISSDGSTILGGDDKAAVAAFLEAIYTIKEKNIPHGKIEFLFTCAEEEGLCGIKKFDMSVLSAKYAFVFDSHDDIGRIVIMAPYHITMDVYIKGRAAHAGMEPEKGISAIRVLSEIISKIPHGRIDPHTTVNAGIISGGVAQNIVAENAYCKLEARSHYKDRLLNVERKIKNVIKDTSKAHGSNVRIKRELEYSGFSIDKNSPIARIASNAVKKLKLNPVFEVSGGGSDTNIINRSGIKAINLSVGMRNVHSTKEYILKKDIINGARLVLAILDSI